MKILTWGLKDSSLISISVNFLRAFVGAMVRMYPKNSPLILACEGGDQWSSRLVLCGLILLRRNVGEPLGPNIIYYRHLVLLNYYVSMSHFLCVFESERILCWEENIRSYYEQKHGNCKWWMVAILSPGTWSHCDPCPSPSQHHHCSLSHKFYNCL